ncbi:MAG: hypothetical protein Q9M20_05035 [Mariprofundaceae bacterium]|nr:hypothetical protein [Mariprofundaceae bacterium]
MPMNMQSNHCLESIVNKLETPDFLDELICKHQLSTEKITNIITKHLQEQELKPYQAELIKLQQHLENSGKRMVILFEGRDAAGKGGTIRRVTRYSESRIEVVLFVFKTLSIASSILLKKCLTFLICFFITAQ